MLPARDKSFRCTSIVVTTDVESTPMTIGGMSACCYDVVPDGISGGSATTW